MMSNREVPAGSGGGGSSSSRDEVLACIGQSLKLEHDELAGEPQFAMTPGWDSLGHLNIIIALESGLGIEFPQEDIPLLTSATAILDYLNQHNYQFRAPKSNSSPGSGS